MKPREDPEFSNSLRTCLAGPCFRVNASKAALAKILPRVREALFFDENPWADKTERVKPMCGQRSCINPNHLWAGILPICPNGHFYAHRNGKYNTKCKACMLGQSAHVARYPNFGKKRIKPKPAPVQSVSKDDIGRRWLATHMSKKVSEKVCPGVLREIANALDAGIDPQKMIKHTGLDAEKIRQFIRTITTRHASRGA